MLKERLAQLLSRKMSGEATAPELQELEQWLQLNPADQYFSDILLTYWNARHDDAPSIKPDRDQHFAHILEMAEETGEQKNFAVAPLVHKVISFPRIKKIAIAALLVGIVGLLAWIINKDNDNTNREPENSYAKNQVSAGKGVRQKIILPDGTKVSLNSDSKLEYDRSFNDANREVVLEGEAYFDVVKDPKRPFIVHTSGIDIRVLGTAFNVKSYPQDPTIEATLIHGLIEVINKKNPKSISGQIKPHQKLVFDKEKNAFVTVDKHGSNQPIQIPVAGHQDIAISLPQNIPDSSLVETSWVYGRLSFENVTFREMAVKMERWFNVEIRFTNEKVENSTGWTVTFENETIEDALDALKLIRPFSYTKEGNKIVIKKNKTN